MTERIFTKENLSCTSDTLNITKLNTIRQFCPAFNQ